MMVWTHTYMNECLITRGMLSNKTFNRKWPHNSTSATKMVMLQKPWTGKEKKLGVIDALLIAPFCARLVYQGP